MKSQLVRCGLVVGLGLAAMGMGACPPTTPSTGGTTGTGGTSTPGATMTALIAHRLNGSWSRFWATRPQQRAA